jgi:hypothetical protein
MEEVLFDNLGRSRKDSMKEDVEKVRSSVKKITINKPNIMYIRNKIDKRRIMN